MKTRAKLMLTTSFLLSFAAPFGALSASDLADALRACTSQANDTARLACYDKLAAQQSARVVSSSPATTSPPPAKVNAEESFGLSEKKLRKPDAPAELKQITSKVAKVDTRAFGKLLVTLANDQVWEQTESTAVLSLHPGDVVKIEAGVLGSHFLVTASNASARVKRLR